jgi:hypothetical protein
LSSAALGSQLIAIFFIFSLFSYECMTEYIKMRRKASGARIVFRSQEVEQFRKGPDHPIGLQVFDPLATAVAVRNADNPEPGGTRRLNVVFRIADHEAAFAHDMRALGSLDQRVWVGFVG